jgi:DNA-binding MarR family transcriptional regulator
MKHRSTPRVDPGPDECIRMGRLCLSASLRRTERIVTRHYDSYLEDAGVTAVQFPMLANIAANEEPTFRSMAEQLDVDRSTLSRNLALLGEKGLVSIGPSSGPKPGRIALTTRGRTALRKAYARWNEAHQELETALSAEGVANALEVLKTLQRVARD